MSAEEATRIARAVQRLMHSRRALRIALPTAAALGAGAAVAAATIPGGDGTIAGCYANPAPNSDGFRENVKVGTLEEPPGALRVIDPSLPVQPGGVTPARECVPNETQITWSQKGPAGPAGAQGPAGPQGPAGESAGGETSFGLDNRAGLSFLKLDGIKGESTDKRHAGDIKLDSFSFGVSNSGGARGSGAGAGKATIQTFTITKSIDKASPLLFGAATTGKHIKYAELLFAHKVKGAEQDFLYIKFSNVLVSGVQDGTSAKGVPQEQVSFAFQKLEETFLGANGKPEATVNFDLLTNKAS